MFLIRRLVTSVVLLVAVFLGASVLLENVAESQLSTGVARTLHLSARPTVQIDAFPILYRVIQGRIPRIDIEARDFTVQGLDVAQLSIDMRGVRADLDVLIRSDRFDLHVERGDGSARITEDAINEFIVHEGVRARVTLRPDDTVFVRVDRSVGGRAHRFEATGRLSLNGRTLSFKPSARRPSRSRSRSCPATSSRARSPSRRASSASSPTFRDTRSRCPDPD
jgi:hypothetical protein